jgi:hypothetical protein
VQDVSQLANARKHRRPKTTTRTLRLESELDEALSRLAESENISVNLLINKSLTRYVEWDANSEKFGLVSVSKRLLRNLFDRIDEDTVRKMGAQSGKEGGPEMVTFFYKKFDLETLLMAFENLTSKYANNFRFEHNFDGKTHTLVMKHDTGLKASAYYAESVKAVFALLGFKAKTVETEAQVVATVNVA